MKESIESLEKKLQKAEFWLNECQTQYDNYDKKLLRFSCMRDRLENKKSKVLEIKKQIAEAKILNQKNENDLLFGKSLV